MRISDWSSDVCSSDLLVDLASTYPNLSVDLLALPRVIQLPRNEADIVITIDRPERGPYVSVKLADYVLRLYASKSYLADTASITTQEHLKGHRFIRDRKSTRLKSRP